MARLIITAGARARSLSAGSANVMSVTVSVSEAATGKPVTGLGKSDFKLKLTAQDQPHQVFSTASSVGSSAPGYYEIPYKHDGLDFGTHICIKVSAGNAPARAGASGTLATRTALHHGQVIVPILIEPES